MANERQMTTVYLFIESTLEFLIFKVGILVKINVLLIVKQY